MHLGFLFCVFISLLLYQTSKHFSKAFNSQFNPNSIVSFLWFLFLLIPLLLNFNKKINYTGAFFILLSIWTFCSSAYFFNWKTKRTEFMLSNKSYVFLKRVFLYNSLAAIGFILVDFSIQGFDLTNLFLKFFTYSNQYMSKRYSGEITTNIFASLGNICSYVIASLGGFLFAYNKSKKTFILAVFPSILITLLQAAKGTVLLSLFLFLGGFASNKIQLNQEKKFISKKSLTRSIPLFVVILLVLLTSIYVRGAYELNINEATIKTLNTLNSYASGHLFAFSDWFIDYIFGYSEYAMSYRKLNYDTGFLTFMSIFQAFGDASYVPQGVYTEYFTNGFITSNIYTIFRGLLIDFGLLGTLFFWFVLGLISNSVYYTIRFYKSNALSLALYPSLIGYYFTSFIVSLLMWKSIIASTLLLMGYYFLSKNKLQ